ncbi:M23 family metallopeptidase [Sulfitobacter sp. D35]|uniref:M23 family metallopeptidase n=1 Tax=Sulfitobacter sp. D35 TaxID=3083252 RepID=UPI00296F3FD6|nr:M23 family metallopeptidase [Sulfitobacter sp. D35]MDW4498765.1 M23 family metallopeptidase [Sulfitobacter sp. D35]
MALGTALLQPFGVGRDAEDPMMALAEDIARLAAIFAEDTLAEGPLAAETQAAAEEVGQTVIAWFTAEDAGGQTRQDRALARIEARLPSVRGFLDGLVGDAGEIADDPSKIIGLIRTFLDLARSAADALTLPAIRAEMEFLKSLVEDDLGLAPHFLSDRIVEYTDVLRRRLRDLPAPIDADQRRRVNLARVTLARFGLRAHLLIPPGIDTEALARMLHEALRGSPLDEALRQVNCALDGIEASLNAAVAASAAVSTDPQPINAGVASKPDHAEYSYFASYLLREEDLPLVGLDDFDGADDFLTTFRDSDNPVIREIRDALTPVESAPLDAFSGGDPEREDLLPIVAGLNRILQSGPVLELGDGDLIPDEDLTDEIRKLRQNYRDDQDLFLLNRRVVEHAFDGDIKRIKIDSTRAFARWVASTFKWPHHQVYVTGDRKYVMCDDMPIHIGEDVKWNDAPIFAGEIPNALWFKFAHAEPGTCEIYAQVVSLAAEAAKAIWHTIEIQPGHEAQNATVCAWEYADLIQQVLWGRPLSGHLLQGGPHLRRFGKYLESFVGVKGIFTFGSSFQNLQSDAPTEKFLHWLTVQAGDIFRTLTPIFLCNLARDGLISFVALLNFGGHRDGERGLGSNPAANHRKQKSFVIATEVGLAAALIAAFPRDNYSIMLFNAGRNDLRPQRTNAMAVMWLAGGLGMGLGAGLVGSFLAQVISAGWDYKRLLTTAGITAGRMFGLFWFYLYIFRENATARGTYRVGGGSFRGYPDRATSPYLLPYPAGVERYCGQANLGLFSHNRITNSNFANPALNAVQQAYAYDFDHDFGEPIACCRGGVVWAFTENIADSVDNMGWNFITIRHGGTPDAEHDDFDGTGAVQTYSVYGHLATNGVTNAPLFGGVTPTAESVTPGSGTPVSQGDLIALAGDTGVSFHNHLHMHVLPDDGTGNPSTVITIPFVFRDMRVGQLPENSPLNNGILKSLTWYRSRNGA